MVLEWILIKVDKLVDSSIQFFILASDLSITELPTNEFKVIPVKGLSENGDVDQRSKDIGYSYLIGSNDPRNISLLGIMWT